MAGTLEKSTAFHQQIFSSNKYAFINSVNLHKKKKNHFVYVQHIFCELAVRLQIISSPIKVSA